MFYKIKDTTLIGIANAIREQYGENTPIATTDMEEAIRGIKGGGGGSASVATVELEKLGYNVPSESPIQNEVEGNVFIKNVGRVHLGALTWTETTIAGRFWASAPVDAKAVQSGGILNYCEDDKDIAFNDSDYSNNARIYLTDSTYANNVAGLSASLDGVYCFYELKETILLLINDVDNLFVPNVPTTDRQGVTFTFNEADNSYTLNGTSTANIYFELTGVYDIELGSTYKLIGVKTDSGVSIYDANNSNGWAPSSEGNVYDIINEPQIYLYIANGTTLKNVVVRPVITTDFDATYDDIVPSLSGGGSGGATPFEWGLIQPTSPIALSNTSKYIIEHSLGITPTRFFIIALPTDNIQLGWITMGFYAQAILGGSTLSSHNRIYRNNSSSGPDFVRTSLGNAIEVNEATISIGSNTGANPPTASYAAWWIGDCGYLWVAMA